MQQDAEIHTPYSRNHDVSMFPPLLGLSQHIKHIRRPRLTHSLTKYEMEFQCKGKQEDGWSDGKPAGSSPHNQVRKKNVLLYSLYPSPFLRADSRAPCWFSDKAYCLKQVAGSTFGPWGREFIQTLHLTYHQAELEPCSQSLYFSTDFPDIQTASLASAFTLANLEVSIDLMKSQVTQDQDPIGYKTPYLALPRVEQRGRTFSSAHL
ncbi:hypothetical protein MG293_018681 [Ovis ammon polii]|uniref:Uncharacterized protein n=1 Tax=Ovis ammon polii TaxID=230172 RepID=A0AAD4TMF9_OVIAM|nr:hypothetical protein MG293_018681 [Ovis ammon polii]